MPPKHRGKGYLFSEKTRFQSPHWLMSMGTPIFLSEHTSNLHQTLYNIQIRWEIWYSQNGVKKTISQDSKEAWEKLSGTIVDFSEEQGSSFE
jgi:hypothetical protein